MAAPAKSTVVVAMSGGIDSSVAAAILLEQGYDVIGVTMRAVACDVASGASPAAQAARQVAEYLGFPHTEVDLHEAFEAEVIGEFVREYAAGRTPNPCIRCNQRIKFGLLHRKAMDWGAQYFATGHYAQVEPCGSHIRLCRGLDPNKDQSYVLAGLSQEQLSRSLFPLGRLTKTQTREIARTLGLPVAERGESQEICFIADNNYRGFLEGRIGPAAPGPILTTAGNVVGRHKGLSCYTVGQRKGLGISAPRPFYVVRLDAKRNAVIVGHEEETFREALTTHSVNWCSVPPPTEPFEAWVQLRYRHVPVPGDVIPLPDGFHVRFRAPQRGVSPGQWAVLYEGDRVLGGGPINDF